MRTRTMVVYEHHETLQLIADHIDAELEDLELIERSGTSCRFRQVSTGETHTAEIGVGPEGPVVSLSE